VSVHDTHSLPATQKVIPILNSNELLYIITFNYVTFAALMDVPAYGIAVDYDRYFILNYYLFESDQREFVSFKYFTFTSVTN